MEPVGTWLNAGFANVAWSLISWFLFGVYPHLRRFHGWQGEKAAYLYILRFAVSLIAIFFTPLLESSIHAAYFK